MRLPKPSDLPSTRIQVGISGTEDAYSSNFDATFRPRLCGLCVKFVACPRRYEPPEAGDRACIGAYEPAGASGALACGSAPSNAPAARPGAPAGRFELAAVRAADAALAGLFESAARKAADAARVEEDRSILAVFQALRVDPDVQNASAARPGALAGKPEPSAARGFLPIVGLDVARFGEDCSVLTELRAAAQARESLPAPAAASLPPKREGR